MDAVGVVDRSTSSGARATSMAARDEQLCSNKRNRCGRPVPVALRIDMAGVIDQSGA